ncbi:DNA polymerase III subunit delta [Chelativorans sp. SCAU2101]|jgi:DNA polymerase III, delta subunit|uniref:DNA polymerase III subunit delta n=1 Tax=Chelativorans petroleitrophicus TaxID=2975484 RepID=A0A9X2XB42_9HYPH|nr:DNA polymerase III subunit delta [Chelativorans petroleitrophicus]MCT8991914.1 DNA polymerase III subunit delta [Chelativorans petroleitrophicus]
MAQKKAHEVDAWLARPDPRMSVVLVYGPDRGLVSERARLFAERSGLPLDDPFCVVKIDGAEIAEPGQLVDEARTVPMFADRRLVWVRNAGSQNALVADVAALVADPPADCLVLIEAGDLKKNAALRTAVERGERAMALPCYSDDARSLDSVIDNVLSAAGLSISLEARQLLKASLGGDRLATRGELEKLALYCAGAGNVTVEDVRAAVGDVSIAGADEAVDAVMCGRIAQFDTLFTRHLAAGAPPFLMLSAALRHVQGLQLMRAQVEAEGKSPAAAVASARPPVFFARRRAVEQAVERWTLSMLQAAAERLQGAVLKSRQHPAVAASVSRQTLLALAIEGARAGR